MSKRQKVKAIEKNSTGRNTKFRDLRTKKEMSRSELVKKIEKGKYPYLHIRKINRIKTPVSNPDGKKGNNLD